MRKSSIKKKFLRGRMYFLLQILKKKKRKHKKRLRKDTVFQLFERTEFKQIFSETVILNV